MHDEPIPQSAPKVQSPSSINLFDICPLQYAHRYVLKTLKFKTSPQIEEGVEFHKAMYLRAGMGIPLPDAYQRMEPTMKVLDQWGTDGWTVDLEAGLAVDADFKPVEWADRYKQTNGLENKLDVVAVKGDRGRIVDWKTGKPKDDITQLLVNSITALAHYPRVESFAAAFAYSTTMTLSQPAKFERSNPKLKTTIKAKIMMIAKAHERGLFPPSPSGLCKSWCDVFSCKHNGRTGP